MALSLSLSLKEITALRAMQIGIGVWRGSFVNELERLIERAGGNKKLCELNPCSVIVRIEFQNRSQRGNQCFPTMSSFFGLGEPLPRWQEIALKLHRVAEFDSCLLIILSSKKLHAAVVIALGALLARATICRQKRCQNYKRGAKSGVRDDEATETYCAYTPYVPSF